LRLEINQPVQVTLLGEQGFVQPGILANLSGRGARILVGTPLPLDSAVRLDWADSLALGEVKYCLPAVEGCQVGLDLQHSLTDLSGLARLAERLLAESPELTRSS